MSELVDSWINKDDLATGRFYVCAARNFTIGLWNGTSFDYLRSKFNLVFWDEEYHWDDGAPHGTVKPIKRLKNSDVLSQLNSMAAGEIKKVKQSIGL